jgi:hypothetical protein
MMVEPLTRNPGAAATASGANRKGALAGVNQRIKDKPSHEYAQACCASLEVFAGRTLIGSIVETVECTLAWSAEFILLGTFADRHAAALAIIDHRRRPDLPLAIIAEIREATI